MTLDEGIYATDLLCQSQHLEIYWLGQVPYEMTWSAMKSEVAKRLADNGEMKDQLWLLHHDPVYTLGTRGLRTGLIGQLQAPVVKSDRGGDVTYHGPGQLVGYPLVQLDRLGLSGAGFVHALEALLVDLISSWGIDGAQADPERPGVYIEGQKIASLGLRCKRKGRRQVSYHGFALNVDMDLSPFAQINPCGYAGQAMVQLRPLLSDGQGVSDEVARSDQQSIAPTAASHSTGLNTPENNVSASLIELTATRFADLFARWHANLL
jgi:lipoyl(octanoyl) transferase